MWNVLSLLQKVESFFKEKEIPSPRLEAELLLAHVLGFDRVKLYTDFSRPVETEEQDRYRTLVMRRAEGEPSAYLTGRKEFFSLEFMVTPDVLIPRPETEEVVQAVLDLEEKVLEMADVGTGTGCIPITLLKRRNDLKAHALDLSSPALEVAKKNAKRHGVARRIRFLQGDLLAPLKEARLDLITCNPPYVDPAGPLSVDRSVEKFEPRHAVFAPEYDAAFFYRKVMDQALPLLNPAGVLIFELGAGMRTGIETLALKRGYAVHEVRPDLAGIDRVMVLRRGK
jgi:release factor glutamine methyltransferase